MQSLDLIYNTPLSLPNIYSFMSIQQQIVYETKNCSDWSETAIDALLRYFLIKLVESMKLVREKYDINAFERIHRLRNEIYREPNRPWNIREMAKSVNFSPSYFQRMYKTAFNTSCMNDVIRARIELAKNLLIQTDLTSREIADQCGYQNETHFSRQFRQHTGVTPREYRRI